MATTRFFFDARGGLVVLDTKVTEWGGSGVLCTKHADRLTVPQGWCLEDRRVASPRLFPIGRFEEPARVIGESFARARRLLMPVASDATPLPLDGGPAYELPEDYESVTTVPAVHPDQAAFDLPGIPDQRTPLLARAFESAGSRVRPGSSLAALIPQTPVEPPADAAAAG